MWFIDDLRSRLANRVQLTSDGQNHAYSVALHIVYYNFVKIHTKLRTSPAIAGGVSDRLWEVSDIVELWEAVEPKAGERGSYKSTRWRDRLNRSETLWKIVDQKWVLASRSRQSPPPSSLSSL